MAGVGPLSQSSLLSSTSQGSIERIRSRPIRIHGSSTTRSQGRFAARFDDQSSLVGGPIPERTPEDNETLVDERVHEYGVLGPFLLVAHRSRRNPSWTLLSDHHEVCHPPAPPVSFSRGSLLRTCKENKPSEMWPAPIGTGLTIRLLGDQSTSPTTLLRRKVYVRPTLLRSA